MRMAWDWVIRFDACPVCHRKITGLSPHLKGSDVCRWIAHRRLFEVPAPDEPVSDGGLSDRETGVSLAG